MISVVISLQGCMYQTVTHYDIKQATKLCATQDSEVMILTSTFLGLESVSCTNGTSFDIWTTDSTNLLKQESKQ